MEITGSKVRRTFSKEDARKEAGKFTSNGGGKIMEVSKSVGGEELLKGGCALFVPRFCVGEPP